MSTHNIGFYEEISKLSLNYHQISSNMHLISSAAVTYINMTMVPATTAVFVMISQRVWNPVEELLICMFRMSKGVS